MAKEKSELSPKRKRFVEEYLKDCNGTQAAIRAGYAKRSAKEQATFLLTNIAIRNAIRELQAVASAQALVDASFVIRSLVEVAQRCMQKVPVMRFNKEDKLMEQVTDEDGEGVWQFDSSGANKALELLGKHLRLFTEKIEFPGKDGQPQEFGRTLTDLERATRFVAFVRLAEERKQITEIQENSNGCQNQQPQK